MKDLRVEAPPESEGCNPWLKVSIMKDLRVEAPPESEGCNPWLKVSILTETFDCPACRKPLTTGIFECSEGHFICWFCNEKILDKKCPVCSIETSIKRSITMEHVMESILVPCSNAKYGCRDSLSYYGKQLHERVCWYAPCFCPESSCSFAGLTTDLLDHLTTQHKCPSTVLPDSDTVSLRLQLGFHVLRKRSSYFFIVSMAPEPFGYAISVVCVQPRDSEPKFTCSMSYDCSATGYCESLSCTIRKSSLSHGLPKGYDLILPKGKISDDTNGIMLIMSIQGEELLSDSDDEVWA